LPISCQHHTNLFLPWHRAYLYFFELSLQDQVQGVTLPWWDWTSPASRSIGVPAAYSDAGSNGDVNPLASSPINEIARSQAESRFGEAAPAETVRQPDDPARLPTPEQIEEILGASDFLDFSQRIEDVHDGIHVWVGGTMSEIPLAAYDPLFFAHHTMIDRLWDLWQLRHPQVGLPAELLPEALPPFRMTVAQTLSVTGLGYDYASFADSVSVGGG
jgi:tyrosinase